MNSSRCIYGTATTVEILEARDSMRLRASFVVHWLIDWLVNQLTDWLID